MMTRFLHAAAGAAAAALASWAITRWLERRAARAVRRVNAVQTWENEGGALAPRSERITLSSSRS